MEVAGSGFAPPAHIGAITPNVGVTPVEIVTTVVAFTAHCPVVGVNVYVVVFELSNAGDHVPVIPSMEVAGNGSAPPAHIEAITPNVGVTPVEIVTTVVAFTAHCPAVGVNV